MSDYAVTLGGRSVGESVSQGGEILENKQPVSIATGGEKRCRATGGIKLARCNSAIPNVGCIAPPPPPPPSGGFPPVRRAMVLKASCWGVCIKTSGGAENNVSCGGCSRAVKSTLGPTMCRG